MTRAASIQLRRQILRLAGHADEMARAGAGQGRAATMLEGRWSSDSSRKVSRSSTFPPSSLPRSAWLEGLRLGG
jgi:hypothetical protein